MLSWDEWDERYRAAPETVGFDEVVESALSRRGFPAGLSLGVRRAPGHDRRDRRLPEVCNWQPQMKRGEKLFPSAGDFAPAAEITVADRDKVFGENSDGMSFVLVGNCPTHAIHHEYANLRAQVPNNPENIVWLLDDVRLVPDVQVVMIGEITEDDDGWSAVVESPLPLRIS